MQRELTSEMTNEIANSSPLLTGFRTGTPIDLITYRLYFLFPLSEKQVEFLNRPIYRDKWFNINNWSLTHTFFGWLWGLMGRYYNAQLFSLTNYLIFHTLFEIWEVWAIHLPFWQLDIVEIIDILMDTLFGVMGYWLAQLN